jgi:Cu(I)/Ag(I) efflux system membrane fusion protein
MRRNHWISICLTAVLAGVLLVSCGGKEGATQKTTGEGHAGHGMPPEKVPQMEHQHELPAERPASPKGEEKLVYHCPMHPEYTSDKPGNCPICGMNLVPVKAEEKEAQRGQEGALYIPQERLRAIGATFGVAEQRRLYKQIRTVGRVTYDETLLKEISIKFSGWVESLYVDFTGKIVRQGEPLFSIYSPELVAAQEEFLLALGAGESALDLREAARRKLRLWDLSEAQILQLEKTGQPSRVVTLHSPVSGFVVEKRLYEGKYVQAGEPLYRIADISRVWLRVAVYEDDLRLLRRGQPVTAEVLGTPGRELRGVIDYIDPYLDEATRTVEVRATFPNPDAELLPGMYASVRISVDLGERLAVPEQAVMFSGERYLVFVDGGNGMLEPREIRPGIRTSDFIEVLAGIMPGDRVVTSANFLIDSESKLKLALSRSHTH